MILTSGAADLGRVVTGRPALNRKQPQSDHIINAFENFEQHTGCVSVQPLTAISPYSTMHEDICSVALDKRVAFVIIPFHKQQTVDAGMEGTSPAYRTINQNVLANAPLLFFRGPDDHEALAYAFRTSEHPGINLTVVRFIPGQDAAKLPGRGSISDENTDTLTVITDIEREKKLDQEYLNEFKSRTGNDESIVFTETVVDNGEDTVAAIREIDNIHDLFIVGSGQGMVSPLTSGLIDWSECPELGTIGDLLTSSDFTVTFSVLVVQQYISLGVYDNTHDTPNQHNPFLSGKMNHRPPPI
ncbi:transporter [Lithospermum erythrorhizon]|uniref:Transporter n=1 Tax=Lithospermum erythrorhizon TaxID=34254 RepID=A0AAV3NUZ7_LITER